MIDSQSLFESSPANQLLGMRLAAQSQEPVGRATVVLPIRPELIQEEGVVHGGFLSTLADTAAVYVLVPSLEEGTRLSGVEFKINFMRPGLPDRGDLRAEAKLVKRGRTLSIVDVEVFQADDVVAKGLFTYMTKQKD